MLVWCWGILKGTTYHVAAELLSWRSPESIKISVLGLQRRAKAFDYQRFEDEERMRSRIELTKESPRRYDTSNIPDSELHDLNINGFGSLDIVGCVLTGFLKRFKRRAKRTGSTELLERKRHLAENLPNSDLTLVFNYWRTN